MEKGIKRGLIIFFSLILLFSGMVKAKGLEIESIIKEALKENIDLKIARLQLENARIDYKKTELNNLLTESKYVQLQGELALVQAEENFRTVKNKLIIDITGQYLELVRMKHEKEILDKEAELERRKLKEVEAQVRVGNMGSLDLFEQRNKYQNALFELERIKDDYNELLKEFKIKTGIDDTEKLDLKISRIEDIEEIGKEAAIETALKNNPLLKIKKKEIRLAEIDLTRARVGDTPELDLKKVNNMLELARLNYEKEEQGLRNLVREKYYLYKRAVKGIELTYQNLLKVKENFDIIKDQQEAGLVTENDLLSAEIGVMKGEKQYLESLSNYYLSRLQLQQVMGIEIGVDTYVMEKE